MLKTVIIHGQNHKGSTYHIAHDLAEKIGGEITEFFLPRDFGDFCLGCNTCFYKSEEKCPHYEKISQITKAIDEADVMIFASPVYAFHVTGAMKAFLDHYGYRWMVHSPEESMFRKQGVCICTAAGAGIGSTLKDMSDSMFFWGTAKIYKYGLAVFATDWESVSEKKKEIIDKKITGLAGKIVRKSRNVKPGIKTRVIFNLLRLLHRREFNKRDTAYWEKKGWLGSRRPWKTE